MLDSKLLRKETKEVISNLKRRGFEFDETLWTKLESKRKDLQGSTENQQAKLNELSKNIGIAKQNSEDTKDLEKMASELTATLNGISRYSPVGTTDECPTKNLPTFDDEILTDFWKLRHNVIAKQANL